MGDTTDRIERVYDAVSAELQAHYGAQTPEHYGTRISWRMGGPDPLDSISIYTHPDGHWHYVSAGMAERADKQTNNPAVSGWGFELTFRLRAAAGAGAPIWPLVLLNDLARYVFESRRPLAHGDFLDRPGDPRGQYWGLVRDPVLRPVDTVNGRFVWLQLVALDEPTFRRLHGDDYQAVLDEHARSNPYFVSTLADPPPGA